MSTKQFCDVCLSELTRNMATDPLIVEFKSRDGGKFIARVVISKDGTDGDGDLCYESLMKELNKPLAKPKRKYDRKQKVDGGGVGGQGEGDGEQASRLGSVPPPEIEATKNTGTATEPPKEGDHGTVTLQEIFTKPKKKGKTTEPTPTCKFSIGGGQCGTAPYGDCIGTDVCVNFEQASKLGAVPPPEIEATKNTSTELPKKNSGKPDISTFKVVQLGLRDEAHHLSLGGHEVSSKSYTLKEGARALLAGYGLDQAYVEAAPESEGKRHLLGILNAGKEKANVD